MGGINPQLPYVISPRRTLLLTNTPTLRWNSVRGAREYRVDILGGKGSIWRTQIPDTQVTYPGDPVLQPGIPYVVVVDTDTRRSSQAENNPGSEFIVLSASEAKAVQTQANAILQSDYDWSGRTI